MILLKLPSDQHFKVLLIASEILIPLIVFVGMYFIFKPVFGKKDPEQTRKEDGEQQ